MGLPAFASTDELGDRIPGGIDLSDETRAQAALDDASSIIRAEARVSWVDGDDLALPDDPDWAADAIKRICIAVARRSFENPDGATAHQESIDGYSRSDSFAESSNDIYLKASEKADIARIVGGTGKLWTLSTTRSDVSSSGVSGGLEMGDCAGDETTIAVEGAGTRLPFSYGPLESQ